MNALIFKCYNDLLKLQEYSRHRHELWSTSLPCLWSTAIISLAFTSQCLANTTIIPLMGIWPAQVAPFQVKHKS
jgi:hypothetical protein